MRKKLKIYSKFGLVLVFMIVACAFPVQAQDNDGDGFNDTLEAAQLTTYDGTSVSLDPVKKDLFVILWSANFLDPGATSYLPANPLELIANSGVVTRQLSRLKDFCPGNLSTCRQVSEFSPQNAVRITENSRESLATGMVLGFCQYGTPNYYDDATVYTARVKEWIETTCANATTVCLNSTCNPKTQVWLDTIRDAYIKNTIAHETGHMMRLTATYDSRCGGYHYKTGTGVIMDQSLTYTNKNSKVTWYITTQYAAGDQPLLK